MLVSTTIFGALLLYMSADVNRPGFDGGCILWEDVAHGSIEAAKVEARIGTSTPA